MLDFPGAITPGASAKPGSSEAHLLPCLVIDAGWQLRPQLDFLARTPVCGLGFLEACWLGSKAESPQRESQAEVNAPYMT